MALRICNCCGLEASSEKDLELFRKEKNLPYGRRNECKKCNSDRSAKTQRTSKVVRNTNLLKKFGITLDDYNLMFTQQKGCCAICEKHQTEFDKRLAVDHCHKSGKVRGLLCQQCNQALGMFYDNVENLKNAISYLEEVDDEQN